MFDVYEEVLSTGETGWTCSPQAEPAVAGRPQDSEAGVKMGVSAVWECGQETCIGSEDQGAVQKR